MTTRPKIGIIGAGNMGGAFFKGLGKIFSLDRLFLCDSNLAKMRQLGAKHFHQDSNKILKDANIIILAIKPQSLPEFCSNLKISLKQKLVISIMAGVSIATLKKALGAIKIVRSMPNLPAQVGYGVTGWVPTKQVTIDEKKLVQKIFATLGAELKLKNETYLDAITALSGSGPAYFFYLCEMLMNKAKMLGFTTRDARIIAENTFIGSAKLLGKNNLTAAQWKQAVTSKGGTTEAALTYLTQQNFENIFSKAIDKAKNRSAQLNKIL